MKKILFFSGDITRPGGTERVSTVIANGLVQTGKYDISFVSIVEQCDMLHFSLSSKIHRFALKKDRRWASPGPGYLPLIPRLRKLLKKQKPDIIIDIDLVLDILSIPASVGLPVKVVSWEHFHYLFEQESFYRRFISHISVRFSDYIVTLTPQDMQNYRNKLHRKNRIDFIYNPLSLAPDTDLSQREKMLITIGHINNVKGIDLLVQIIPALLCSHEDWKWYFLGSGDYQYMLEQIRLKYHLENRLILAGVVPNVADYLNRASICVLASRTEAFGMCILEAKACGVPCVCFDVPYGPALIINDEVNGFLIPPFDLKKMEEKIMLLMEDDALRNRFSQNTVLGMENFRLESILRKWEHLLDGLTDSLQG